MHHTANFRHLLRDTFPSILKAMREAAINSGDPAQFLLSKQGRSSSSLHRSLSLPGDEAQGTHKSEIMRVHSNERVVMMGVEAASVLGWGVLCKEVILVVIQGVEVAWVVINRVFSAKRMR